MTTSPLVHPPARSARYRNVLTIRRVLRLLAGAVIGHLPVAMAPWRS